MVARAMPPLSLRGGVARRVELLPSTAREVLLRLAVAGLSLDLQVAIAAGARAEPEVLDGIEAGLATGLLVEEERPGGGVAFAHALVRDALLAGIPSVRHRDWRWRLRSSWRPSGAPRMQLRH
jgi:hypothetical protein